MAFNSVEIGSYITNVKTNRLYRVVSFVTKNNNQLVNTVRFNGFDKLRSKVVMYLTTINTNTIFSRISDKEVLSLMQASK